ncbi:MAG: choice-of-anchor D domain-containing protein [Nannocystis sp.]|nr:choice-of-anchor D domain-containing protein [Nannocystis sp.]MBA3550456.1 choice-of-anchor D domain-containing protein [Nannocystis sp.]
MPTCSNCGGNINCPTHAHVVAGTAQACPLMRGALWVQVIDDKGTGVGGVEVNVTGGPGTGPKTTDAHGLVAYDPLDQDDYSVTMPSPLPSPTDTTHKPPLVVTKAATVQRGQIAFVKFELLLKQPKIQLIDAHDFLRLATGLTTPKKITIKNIGDADLVIKTLSFPAMFPAGGGNALTNGTTVQPGAEVELEVSFAPTASGDHEGDLTIESNDPDMTTAVVRLKGHGIPPWKLSVKVTSIKRGVIGVAPAAWPDGDIKVGVSATADTHGVTVKAVTHALLQSADGTFTLTDVHTGNATTTLHVWAHSVSGAWSSRADVAVTLEPGDDKTVDVEMKPLVATLTIFRGATILAVIPFSTTDMPDRLDAPILDTDQGNDAAPSALATGPFTFPLNTSFADNVDANAEPALFRLRVTLDVAPEAPLPPSVEVTLKVLTATGLSPSHVSFGNGPAPIKTASHVAGMKATLEQITPTTWESPYMRVATTHARIDPAHVLVHSVGPSDSPMSYPPDKTILTDCQAIMDAGKQFGRKLAIEGALYGAPFTAEPTMGGAPYARVPVKLLLASNSGTDPTNKLKRVARIKMHQLNAWWAGQGIEFELIDPLTPLHRVGAPPRRLITVGEHTGKDHVSLVDFDAEVKVLVTATGKAAFEETIPIAAIAKDQTPAQVAAAIVAGLRSFVSVHGDHAGLAFDADVFDLGGPRAFLQPRPFPNESTLPLLGTRGPVDVVIKAAGIGIDALEITGVAVNPTDQGIDIYAPPMAKPYHEAVFSPPASTARQWARAYGGGNADHVAVLIESTGHVAYVGGAGWPKTLCETGFATLAAGTIDALMENSCVPVLAPGSIYNAESKSKAVTLLNFGRWTEGCASFLICMAVDVFSTGADDVQHEMGHALADLDHTIPDPAWWYLPELMHTSSADPKNALKITRHKIHVTHLKNDGGTWKLAYKELASGYGGAIRTRIGSVKAGWVVNGAFNNWT